MIAIDNLLISEEVIERQFVCNLTACKGACCVEGDAGAPLEKEEVKILKKELKNIKPFLTKEGIEAIEKHGVNVVDEGTLKTTLMKGGPCAFVTFDEKGITKCGIEKAYEAGATTFHKPISCHLYPIRVTKSDDMEFLNYDEWYICKAACTLGKKLQVPVYQFLKAPLIRKYGEEMFEALEATAKHLNSKKQ